MHSSPLILGNDVRYMSDEIFAIIIIIIIIIIITNSDLIVRDHDHEDAVGHEVRVVWQTHVTRRLHHQRDRLRTMNQHEFRGGESSATVTFTVTFTLFATFHD